MKFFSAFRENRFLFLLISMFLLMLLQPVLSTAEWHLPQVLLKVFVSFVFLSAVYAVSRRPRMLLVGILLMFPSFGMQWAEYFIGGRGTIIVSELLSLLFFATIAVAIVRHVLEIDKVTFEQVCGTLCAYMLIGLFWANAYVLVDVVFGAQFGGPVTDFSEYVYFSFVTLTTLGYGDISPIGVVARSFAVVEAIIGQFFLAVLVARQVGLYISQSDR